VTKAGEPSLSIRGDLRRRFARFKLRAHPFKTGCQDLDLRFLFGEVLLLPFDH